MSQGVLGLAPWIPERLALDGLRGKRLDVLHGSWDRYLPGIPGVSAASSRAVASTAPRALGIQGTYTLIPRGLHGAALRRPSGTIQRLPCADAWVEGVAQHLERFQADGLVSVSGGEFAIRSLRAMQIVLSHSANVRCPRFRPCVRAIELRGLPSGADTVSSRPTGSRFAARRTCRHRATRRRLQPRVDARPDHPRRGDPAPDALPRDVRALASAGSALVARHPRCDSGAPWPQRYRRDLVGVDALEADEVVGVFPEGGIRREGPWLRGAARMALATGAPLLPVRLLDTRKAFGRHAIAFPPLAALIGEPIAVERTEPTAALARELTDRLQAAVESLGT